MPERWLREEDTGELKAVYEAHATLPFAIGNRSCIGRKLALNQMHYMIAEVKNEQILLKIQLITNKFLFRCPKNFI